MDAGSDNLTPVDQLNYDVFMGTSPGTALGNAAIASAKGVTETVVISPATLAYFVVRARDGGDNYDSNTVELSVKTHVSCPGHLQPIAGGVCLTCHTQTHSPFNQPYYDPGFAYDSIMSQNGFMTDLDGTPGPDPVAVPFDSAGSLLYAYTNYTPPQCPYMPYNLCAQALSLQQVGLIERTGSTRARKTTRVVLA